MSRLVVRGLRVTFGEAKVLEDVDVDVQASETVGLVGRNGAGKTTTLRAISGVVPRQSGTITFDGQILPADPRRVARAGISHVPEGRGIFGSLTVEENLRFGSSAVGLRHDSRYERELLEMFPKLGPLLGRRAGQLSGGEQQMLTICRGLIARPKLLMVDELSLGLSPLATHEAIQGLLRAARQLELAVLVVDQNVRSLSRVCDRLYVLVDGRTRHMEKGQDAEEAWRAVYLT
jgi:branched-chain amino acid transport system ATP-binding protein